MIAVVQRVTHARVVVADTVVGEIDRGLAVLVAVVRGDTTADIIKIADKLVALRVFPSAAGAYDQDVRQVGGSVLLVSNFTVAADVTGGRRPSFIEAMPPAEAKPKFEELEAALRQRVPTATGTFGADMRVEIANDGPLTLIVDSRE
jgi:D-tyrosyl-tRNA(Tyr) deacylase